MVAVAVAAPGCVAEHDVDAYIVLPDVESACQMLGAQAADVTVETLDGEVFDMRVEPCLPQLAGEPASGFHALIERLGPGYHRVDATIVDPDGNELGARSLPFPVDVPLVVALTRADLPGWPRVAIDIAVPACVAGGELAEVRLVAAPPDSEQPEVDEIVPCDGGTAATRRITVPRGPIEVSAEGRRLDGTPCWTGDTKSLALDGVVLEVELARSCS